MSSIGTHFNEKKPWFRRICNDGILCRILYSPIVCIKGVNKIIAVVIWLTKGFPFALTNEMA